MTEHTIRWAEHRARVGALEAEIARLRSQLDERGEWIVQARERHDQLRTAARRVVDTPAWKRTSLRMRVSALRAVLEDHNERTP